MIAYEPHPVSAERKAELRAKGFKIIDVRFKPVEPIAQTEVTTPPKRTAKRKGVAE